MGICSHMAMGTRETRDGGRRRNKPARGFGVFRLVLLVAAASSAAWWAGTVLQIPFSAYMEDWLGIAGLVSRHSVGHLRSDPPPVNFNSYPVIAVPTRRQ